MYDCDYRRSMGQYCFRSNRESVLDPEVRRLTFVNKDSFNEAVPCLPPMGNNQDNFITYHIVFHQDCNLSAGSALDLHLKNGCAQQLNRPVVRHDPRYLPVNKSIKDRPSTPNKRSGSPLKENAFSDDSNTSTPDSPASGSDIFINDNTGIEVPACIDEAHSRHIMKSFEDTIIEGLCCAVTGKGKPWCRGMFLAPGVHACHIVPPTAYHLYPLSKPIKAEDKDSIMEEKLREAWELTWNHGNGILLSADLHALFDARLWAIHPTTHRIRVFAPCNTLIEYNGEKPYIHTDTDERALRFHYEMCCRENLTPESTAMRPPP
ncbi:hypothetical protein EV127DRAFT_495311 [Xylaria flabelliformis]|nr:hypothetical protein EV127DRAFT_495311 [Xylaria flabelliformis]